MEASAPERSEWTISHVMIETMINWGIRTVFGMVGHSNLGLAEAVRIQESRNKLNIPRSFNHTPSGLSIINEIF